MNHNTATLIRQSDGEAIPKKKKRKKNFNPRLCPELDNIGFHIVHEGKCIYCGRED